MTRLLRVKSTVFRFTVFIRGPALPSVGSLRFTDLLCAHGWQGRPADEAALQSRTTETAQFEWQGRGSDDKPRTQSRQMANASISISRSSNAKPETRIDVAAGPGAG